MPYNKKIAIVYKSKYGCTMKYAGWMAIKLNADLYEISDVGRWDLLKYRTIVYGGPIYNKEIYGLDFILDRFDTIKNKTIIVFAVGLNLENEKDTIDYNINNYEIQSKIKTFFLNGAINYEKLSKIDKSNVKKIANKGYVNKNIFYNEYEKNGILNLDNSDKKSIEPIIDYILEKTYLLKTFK